jgi:hypothetical protein
MRTEPSKRILLTVLTAGACLAGTSMAALTPTSDDFSSSTNTFGSWVDVGSTATLILHDVPSEKDWWDGDSSTNYPDYVPGTNMVITGDGLLKDGGIRVNTQNAVPGDEAIGLTIAGTMESNTVVTFSGNFYNDNTSYTDVKAQLWNETDGTLLADSGPIRVINYNNDAYRPIDFSLKYTVTAADHGDTLQIRFRDFGNAAARDVYVDHFSLTSSPGFWVGWNFNSDGASGTVLTNDLPRYDYTSSQAYVGSNAVANTLAFNGRSTLTDYIIRDKGVGHESALYFKTLNTANDDFGIYIQKLDCTWFGENSSNVITVSWSFDILGYDSNGNLDPANWTVNVRGDNNSPNINVSDAWFAGGVIAQTFSFADDSSSETAKDGTWTTVTGSVDIPVGQAGFNGGIQISTDGGGYTSAGGIFLDNIEVTLTSSEPQLLDMFDAWAASYGLTNALTTEDPDNDLYNNLWEYGMGGDPTNAADIGYIPEAVPTEAGGSSWLYYIHPENDAAALAGLNYQLETAPVLIPSSWTDSGYEVLGTAADGFGAGFNAVTNRISTESDPEGYIKLTIDGI